MARSQAELQQVLEAVMGSGDVFMQAPTVLPAPCIKYERSQSKVSYADNVKYLFHRRYQVTVIDRDPDSPIPDRVEALEHCSFDRFFVANGLNHWVYNLYF